MATEASSRRRLLAARIVDSVDVLETLNDNNDPAFRKKEQELIDDSLELQLLTINGPDYLNRLSVQNQQLGCLKWLFHFDILSRVPLTGSVSYTDLAEAASVPESQLRRIARMAILAGILTEPKPNQIAHSRLSALFMDPELSALGSFLTSISAPMPACMVNATEKWGDTEEKNHTAYNIAYNTDLSLFEHVAANPDLRAKYAQYMQNKTANEGLKIQHLIDGFDWASLGDNATVIDVGGSTGHASIALTSAFPNLRCIVQDLPDTIRLAGTGITTKDLPESQQKRLTFQEHNFFEPQPEISSVANGPVVFLTRMIIHDWRDPEAITILRNLAQALKAYGHPLGRIIVMDIVLPPPGELPRSQEAVLRLRDLTMLQAHNSREREREEWHSLCQKAEDGLHIVNIVNPPGSVLAVIEVSL